MLAYLADLLFLRRQADDLISETGDDISVNIFSFKPERPEQEVTSIDCSVFRSDLLTHSQLDSPVPGLVILVVFLFQFYIRQY